MTFGTWRWWGQPHAPAAFTPRRYSWCSFSLRGLSWPQAHGTVGRNMSLKNPVTPPGIVPGTVRLVAQRLNHYAPTYIQCTKYIIPLNVRHSPSMCFTCKAFVRPLRDNRSERYCVVGLSGQTELSFHDHDNQDPLWCFHLNYPEVCISACLTYTKMREWKYPRKNDSHNGTNLKRSFLIILGSLSAFCASWLCIAATTGLLLTLNKTNRRTELSVQREVCSRIE
jgi:hypothetical protein